MRKEASYCVLLLTLLLSILLVQARNLIEEGEQQQPSCSSSCGDIHNIKYPFRLKGDPSNCGDPDYEFSCINNATFLEIFPGKYYVKNISYSENLLRLVDVNFANGTTCSLPSGSLGFFKDFRYKGYVDYATQSRIRFINCTTRNVTLDNMNPDNYTSIPCLSRNGSHYMYAVLDGMYYSNEIIRKSCSLVSVAPVDYHDVDDVYKSPSYEGIVKVLKGGFDMGWSVECRDCNLEGKQCLYGPKAWEKRPILFECGKEYHELGPAEMNLLITGIAFGAFIGLVIVVAVLVFVIRKCKKRKQDKKNLQNQQS